MCTVEACIEVKKKKISRILALVAISVVVIIYIFPLFWLGINSLKTNLQTFDPVPRFIFRPTLRNYKIVLSTDIFGRSFRLSILLTLSSTFVTLLLGTMAGYVFSRYRMKLKNDIMFFILLTRMIPPIVALVPIYILY